MKTQKSRKATHFFRVFRLFPRLPRFDLLMHINKRDRSKVLQTPHGSEIRPLVDRTNSAVSQCSLAEELLPPGHSVSPHHHDLTEEIYYIVEGKGRMIIDEDAAEVGPGDAVYIPRGSRHTLTNTGVSMMRILLVCGPAYAIEDHRSENE